MTQEAVPAKDETVFEWHRVEGAVLSSLLTGAAIVLGAPIFGAVAFVVFKHDLHMEIAFGIVAGICVVIGPAYAILKLAGSLREDASLAARSDGIVFERNGKAMHLTWDDIERVELGELHHKAGPSLIFRRKSDEPFVLHERFAMIETAELQKRLEELRRKASFGLLPKD